MKARIATIRTLAAAAAALLLWPASVAAQAPAEDAAFFKQNCASCHTIGGGRLTGPDLKDVTKRQDRAWLADFIVNPQAKISAGDAYAAKLLQEARGVLMPAVAGINRQRADALLALIDAESAKERSQFAGSQLSDRPFTEQDIRDGHMIFTGAKPLSAGGPACISCHSARGVGGLGGGRLGPDLTLAYERLQGRKGLSAWLLAPASPTMTPVYRNRALTAEEVLAVTSYLEDAARKGAREESTAALNFFLLGMGAMVCGLVLLDVIWKKRLRGVRSALVHRRQGEEQ